MNKEAKVDMEMVDVVDQNCNILYPILKTEAHAKGLLHKTVIGGVINSLGERLLVKQSSDRQEPGQYVSPMGGHVSSGESDEEAMRREVMEELGLIDIRHKFIGKIIFNTNVLNRQENHYFIVYEVYSDKDPILNEEGESFTWFKEKELKNELKHNPNNFGASYYFILRNLYPQLLK